jgi:hypothetical protein
VVDRVVRLRGEADPEVSFGVLVGEDLELEELAALWLSLTEHRLAAAAAEKAVGEELARRLAAGSRGVEASGSWIYYGSSKREVCVDPVAFFDWLAKHPELLAKTFNANTARKGSIPPAVRDTFFEKVDSIEPRLTSVPVEVLETNRIRKAPA